jgi:hypothetical protein
MPVWGTLLVAGLVVLVMVFAVWTRRAQAEDRALTAAFAPDPNNMTELLVRGWNRAELERILTDFLRQYDLPPISTLRIAEKPNGVLAVTFPADILPKFLFFMVNYIRYPKDMDDPERSIAVLCRAVLTAAFGLPDPALVGQRAEIYVPADDTDFDLVYARIGSGAAYKISFTNLKWKPVPAARLPVGVAGL